MPLFHTHPEFWIFHPQKVLLQLQRENQSNEAIWKYNATS
jgi:hypothetical protein